MTRPSPEVLQGLTPRDLPTRVHCDACSASLDLERLPEHNPEAAGWLNRKDGLTDVTNLCRRCRVREETEQATLCTVLRTLNGVVSDD